LATITENREREETKPRRIKKQRVRVGEILASLFPNQGNGFKKASMKMG
jgi:hypothetical protein